MHVTVNDRLNGFQQLEDDLV